MTPLHPPLKCTKKAKTHFLKKKKILFPTLKYEYTVAKSKIQRTNDLF